MVDDPEAATGLMVLAICVVGLCVIQVVLLAMTMRLYARLKRLEQDARDRDNPLRQWPYARIDGDRDADRLIETLYGLPVHYLDPKPLDTLQEQDRPIRPDS